MTKSYLTYSRDLGDFKHDLIQLQKAGLYGIRLICKGKSTSQIIDRIEELIAFNNRHNLSLEILVDLPGDKCLIGTIGSGLKIEKGETYTLYDENKSQTYTGIPTINFIKRIDRQTVFVGDIISIADGELELKITSISDDFITGIAMNSFLLKSNRSFNIRGNKMPATPLSNEDKVLLETLKSMDIRNKIKILISFVTSASHIKYVKDIAEDFKIIAKIENVIPQNNLEEITKISNGIMLGRGDLSGNSKMSELFPFQKLVIEKCKAENVDFILATGLFADLKNSGTPSISDIMDFGFLRSLSVASFLIAGSNASQFPFETLNLISNFDSL